MPSPRPSGPPAQPVFSIIVPMYNASETLKKTLESLVLQSLDNSLYEILVIDDGSLDHSAAIAEKIAESAPNLRLLRNSVNRGLGATRNHGIREARGRYVCFTDADDILQSYALELFLQRIRSHNPQVVYANIDRVNAHGELLKSICRHDRQALKVRTIRGDNSFCAVSAAYCRDFLLGNRIFFAEDAYYEDMAFTVACVLCADNIELINAVLYHWVERQGSITGSMSADKVADAVSAVESVYALLQQTGYEKEYARAWKKLALDFMLLTHRRAEARPDSSQSLQGLLRKLVMQSPAFTRLGVAQELLPKLEALSQNAATVKALDRLTLIEAAAGAVVMIAETDYHLRNYAAIARELAALGIKSMLCDFSVSSCFKYPRSMKEEELRQYTDVTIFRYDGKKQQALFTNAKAYIFSIDWGQFHPLLVAVKRSGIPAVAFYEGISDDFLSHSNNPQKLHPYRNVPYLIVPGEYYRHIYAKQKIFVAGLPVIQNLLREPVSFPARSTAVINVNFSYGVLEDCRDAFLGSAIQACKDAEMDIVFSQHPADKGDISPYRPSENSIYDCLRQGSLLISRFSTCVLEALALGKPVIYHNPHGETFPKFMEPLGAFRITRSREDLARALTETVREIHAGTDFRKRASEFLHLHANARAKGSPARSAALAVKEIVDKDAEQFMRRVLFHAGRLPPRPGQPKKPKKLGFTQLLHELLQCGKENIKAAWRDPGLIPATLKKMAGKK